MGVGGAAALGQSAGAVGAAGGVGKLRLSGRQYENNSISLEIFEPGKVMTRLLILHCGPMKTGSTAIQDILELNREKLFKLGISYHYVRAKKLLLRLEEIVVRELHSPSKVILLSSEFFAQVNPVSLKKIIQSFNGNRHAIFVSRPLCEIYPSLYLQNLKGSSRRITSFKYFLDRQISSDLAPEKKLGGQLMNFPTLDDRLSSAGCMTHWIQYSRDNLFSSFGQSLEEITGIPLNEIFAVKLAKAKGLSPRRSLRMELAGVVRGINYLNRVNLLHDQFRALLLVILLDVSDLLNNVWGSRSSLSGLQLKRCNAVDNLINEPFLDSRGIFLKKKLP